MAAVSAGGGGGVQGAKAAEVAAALKDANSSQVQTLPVEVGSSEEAEVERQREELERVMSEKEAEVERQREELERVMSEKEAEAEREREQLERLVTITFLC